MKRSYHYHIMEFPNNKDSDKFTENHSADIDFK